MASDGASCMLVAHDLARAPSPLDGSRILRRVSTDKIDDDQFAALFNELQARGDKQKLMQLFGA